MASGALEESETGTMIACLGGVSCRTLRVVLRKCKDAMVAWDFCRVEAPARLHLGFLDMHGGFGRRFGSIGIAIANPYLELSASPAPVLEVTGEQCERVRAVAERFLHLQQAAGESLRLARLQMRKVIPAHRGFGSGTQLMLAVTHSLARLNGLTVSNRELMRMMGRGRRSGAGVGAFECGGLIVDGGKGDSDLPPPRLARLPIPDAWRVVLISDSRFTGMQGEVEDGAFEKLPGFSASCAAYLSRIVLMELLPGVAENDFLSFAGAAMRLQETVGDYFSSVQGGRYASLSVRRVIEHFRQLGIRGVGQSSWGPTGFIFAPDEHRAREFVDMGQQAFPDDSSLGFAIARFNNKGASISPT